ncbi:MAG: Gfo/Idh/MocA family oxidoreductase [Mesorhizobium sp.]|uniref:Gfo/Idh/MocA family protein n=1 Tax=Mesorhizobium sp. TaxID=1871066 RepID=UPI000FE9F5CF|nr:Gfo/Idh/MocA family oxidoreductase [Mesorhizobium sp.]RWI50285.1 MAG: Gfo/Idh/MocA family oxidoreductase [Mesorhizobium sp.]
MTDRKIGIVVNGATGGICVEQHLRRSLIAIRQEGGHRIGEMTVMPELLLVGRNEEKLARVAREFGLDRWTTDLDLALSDDGYPVFFDAGFTGDRPRVLMKAIEQGRHLYSEKPVAPNTKTGLGILRAAREKGIKHGAVEDKLFLPGLAKLKLARENGFLGRPIGFRLDFGWWVFTGTPVAGRRPSWNYRRRDGGGLILDMHPHWRYIVEGVLGPIRRVVAYGWTGFPERLDEQGEPYSVDVEDNAITLVELESGAAGTITSSWSNRVRRDDLLTFQVDGTEGSAVAGLHKCHIQSSIQTPHARWNVSEDIGRDYWSDWAPLPDLLPARNGYRAGWEAFLAHVVSDLPAAAGLDAGIRDVALAEASYRSMASGSWVSLADLLAE